MKINRILPVEMPKIEGSPKQYGINTLKADVFEKSKTPSFKGDNFLDALIDIFVDKTVNSLVDNVTEIVLETIHEAQVKAFMDVVSTKQIKAVLDQNKNIKMQDLVNLVYSQIGLSSDFIMKLFDETGMNNTLAFRNYLRIYNSSPDIKKIFDGQEVEALRLYSQLKVKDDFSKYPELLLYMFNQNEAEKDEDKKVDLNEVTEFLHKIGLKNFKDFDEQFKHLSIYFNNFENISDKYDAVTYLMLTHEVKTGYIDKILQEKPQGKSATAEKIYFANPDVIDYLFEKNGGKSLEPLSGFIDTVSSDKIKKPALKQISGYFNEFSSPEHKIDFYKFMQEHSLTPDDINALAKTSFVSDGDILTNMANKDMFVKEISSLKAIDNSQAYNLYKNFSDFLNAIYSEQEADNTSLKTFFKTIDMFGVNNSQEMLVLYNNINGLRQKSVTSEEFREFIDLMDFCPSKNILKDAKTKKISPVDILRKEQEKFISVKQEIEQFISSDDMGYFIGLSPKEVYRKYKDLISKDTSSVREVLENIIKLNIENSSDYTSKTEKLKAFEGFFDNKRELFEFIEKSNIKLDASPEDDEYINNCQIFLSELKNSSCQDSYKTRLNCFINSEFLPKSKKSLSDFFSKYTDTKERQRIISLFADRRIPSIKEFEYFIKKYTDKDGKFGNILIQMENLPENINFAEYKRILALIQKQILQTNVPIKIKNKNIQSINIGELHKKDTLSNDDIVQILNVLTGVDKNSNFISSLRQSFVTSDKTYSKFEIALEIVNKIHQEDDSYNNIMSQLKLGRKDLGLGDTCADYLYIKAIAEALPEEFISFVNSDGWLKIDENSDKIANLSLHARLRLLDRFALQHCEDISDLYTDETKEYVSNVLKAIYVSNPDNVYGNGQYKNIITLTHFDGDNIRTVFGQDGKMVTVIAIGR